MNRWTLFHLKVVAILLAWICLGARAAFSANTSDLASETPSELSTLNSWMENAKKTAVGNDLLKVLNTSTILLKQNPQNKRASFMRGYLYGIIGCTGYAIADLSKAIEDDPSLAAAYTERGICYMDLKMYSRAKPDLDKAISLNPYSADARFAHGRLMLEMDRPQAAESDFRACQNSACKFSPVLPGELPANFYNGVEYYLGVSCEAQGKLDAALRYYKAAAKTKTTGGSGYIKRYSDQPLDASLRASKIEVGL